MMQQQPTATSWIALKREPIARILASSESAKQIEMARADQERTLNPRPNWRVQRQRLSDGPRSCDSPARGTRPSRPSRSA